MAKIIAVLAPQAPAGHVHDTTRQFDVSEFQPARARWYDAQRHYGFVNVFGDNADYYIHKRQLRSVGMRSLMPGEALGVVPSEGHKRPKVLAVQAWTNLGNA
ncbi:MAG: hypothetical protein AAFN76_12710 [Pseudomonadota bacterium]